MCSACSDTVAKDAGLTSQLPATRDATYQLSASLPPSWLIAFVDYSCLQSLVVSASQLSRHWGRPIDGWPFLLNQNIE